MYDRSIYDSKTPRVAHDCLIEIAQLARVGASSTDSALNLTNMNDAHCTLFDMIHRIALEGAELAED